MPLGKKMVTLFLVLGISFSLCIFVVLQFMLYPGLRLSEDELAEAALGRVLNVFQEDLLSLKALNLQYVSTHQVDKPTPESMGHVELERMNADYMALFNSDGSPILELRSGPLAATSGRLYVEGLAEWIALSSSNMRPSFDGVLSGHISSSHGVMQVSLLPVASNLDETSSTRSLVTGRLLTHERTVMMGERANAHMELKLFNLARSDESNPIGWSSDSVETSVFSAQDPKRRYHQLHDVFGNRIGNVSVAAVIPASDSVTELTQTTTSLFAGLTVVFLVASYWSVRKNTVEPLQKLVDSLPNRHRSGMKDPEARVNKANEIGEIARAFSSMSTELGVGKRELEKARDDALAISSAKSDFIAKMSHEIRTPMSGVLGMTELLKRTPLTNKQMKFTDTILDSAHSLLEVINNILDFSKIEAGKIQLEKVDTSLKQLVEDVVESHAAHAHSQQTELMISLPVEINDCVKTDRLRLRQVLNNLISNAIKFTRDGEVVVRLSASEPENNRVSVVFDVVDSGIGIDPQRQGSIFETFSQAEKSTTRLYGGSGLGLTICKQLIEQMGGELTVVSQLNEGSTFSFALTMEVGSSGRDEPKTRSAIAEARVLVADGHPTHRDILERQLSAWGAIVETSTSSEDAYTRLVSAMSDGNPYELILVNLDMSDRVGIELVRDIRANPRFELLKIIVLSSLSQPVPTNVLDDFNVAGELSKPIRQSQLHYALDTVMRHQRLLSYPGDHIDQLAMRLVGRVLVVEDNKVNRQIAISMLESMGLETDFAVNGLQAAEMLSSNQFDLVLMDCQLPIMNGLEATEAIRYQEQQLGTPRIPVIAATANAFEADLQQCFESGMDACITKPFTIHQLFETLSVYLEGLQAPIDQDVGGSEGDENRSAVRLTSVIDETVLSRLSQLQQPGAPDIVRKLLSLYLQSSSVIKDRLGNAIDSANEAVVRESAHALKSSSMNVGATELAKLCKRLETLSRTGSIANPSELRASLETEYHRVVAAVESELRGSLS